MRIVRLEIHRFRCIRSAILFPVRHNVYLGPNNIGKTAILEALNLLLNPEIGARGGVVDENDFYRREYRLRQTESEDGLGSAAGKPAPPIQEDGETTVAINDAADEPELMGVSETVSATADDSPAASEADGPDAAEGDAEPPIIRIEAIITDLADDDLTEFASVLVPWDAEHRALQRPITLEPYALFSRLLQSQDGTPKDFESVLDQLEGSILPLFKEPNFARVVNEYRQELLRYLPLANVGDGRLSFEATDRTREQVKTAVQLYVEDEIALPLQKMGAGTRSLAILAILLLIARKRGRGIIALEEPETFLFPHAQRRVIDEVLALASQTFVTTHSPYVLERLPVESFQRLLRDDHATVSTTPLVEDTKMVREIRDRFRKQLSEALLGRGAIVVEEESTRLWVLRASALLHGQEFENTQIEAIELQGICVVTAIGNGDVPGVAALLRRAGLDVLGFLDQVTDAELEQYVKKAPDLPLVFHAEKGLEDLLLRELPRAVVREVLIAAPHAKHRYAPTVVDGWTDEEFNKKAREFLRQHKGYQPLHEWLMDQIDLNAMPLTFKRFVAHVMATVTGQRAWSICSLIPGS